MCKTSLPEKRLVSEIPLKAYKHICKNVFHRAVLFQQEKLIALYTGVANELLNFLCGNVFGET